MARRRYDTSDETLYTPVSPEEVDGYLAGKGRMLAGRSALLHFLYRVRVTLATAEQANQGLRRAVERATESKRRVGAPTTLSPIDAVRYASPEEMSAIVGHLNSTQLNALAGHVAEARGIRDALAADLTRVRTAATDLAGSADLDAAVRSRFVTLLNQLPADPAPVATPRALEMAQLAGLVDAPAEPETAAGELPAADDTDDTDDLLTHTPARSLRAYIRVPAWKPGPGLL